MDMVVNEDDQNFIPLEEHAAMELPNAPEKLGAPQIFGKRKNFS